MPFQRQDIENGSSLTSLRDIYVDQKHFPSQKEATLLIYVHLPVHGFSGAIPWGFFYSKHSADLSSFSHWNTVFDQEEGKLFKLIPS